MRYSRTFPGVSIILFGAASSHFVAAFAAPPGIVTSNPPWPYGNQLYQAEDLLYESSNIGGRGLNCNPVRDGTTPSAQWVRIVSSLIGVLQREYQYSPCSKAYHDMATHNVEDGTGGLDASIRFELDRVEVRRLKKSFISNINGTSR